MNKVILKGNIGKDPEIKTFDWGKVAKFSLATSETYKNKNDEKVTETEWHTCIFKGTICDVIEQYVHKGDQLLVEGKIVTRTYKDKSGESHWTTEVICHSFEFCGTKERIEQKPDNKEGQWQGKKEVKAMSDVNELPGAESDPSYEPPF